MSEGIPVSTAPFVIATLNLPRTLYAAGALTALRGELETLGVHRPLLVSDKGLAGAGIVSRAVSACGEGSVPVVFADVTENPLFADVDRGAALYRERSCDGVIALGGGSVIDTAKVIALLATNAGSAASYVGVPGVPHVASAPLIVIPTTAGTGSEASPSAGIHPDAATSSVGMNSPHLIPRVAILDPELTRSPPPRLTATTGIDALSHCIEGFLSKKTIPLGKAIALHGIALVTRHLRRAVADRDDVEARGEMMMAAYAGGVSIAMGLGPAHAIALSCSDQGFHHGVLSGIGLVATIDATAARVPEKAASIGDAMGLSSSASIEDALARLMRELGLPATLGELGYRVEDPAIATTRLGDSSHRSHFNASAPFHPSAAEYAAMISGSLGGC
ncbi:iron-containing alcohol dehydrogenase [soil metagenome]